MSENISKHEEFVKRYLDLPSCICYVDNKGYRDTVRKVFNFDSSKITTYDDQVKMDKIYKSDELDDETMDELSFDGSQMEKGMEILYELTKDEVLFQDLYMKAAGRMFSTDPRIGQAVLCSYDMFFRYHTTIWFFLLDGFTGVSSCQSYQQLCNQLK